MLVDVYSVDRVVVDVAADVDAVVTGVDVWVIVLVEAVVIVAVLVLGEEEENKSDVTGMVVGLLEDGEDGTVVLGLGALVDIWVVVVEGELEVVEEELWLLVEKEVELGSDELAIVTVVPVVLAAALVVVVGSVVRVIVESIIVVVEVVEGLTEVDVLAAVVEVEATEDTIMAGIALSVVLTCKIHT